jgi:hypothetical protein
MVVVPAPMPSRPHHCQDQWAESFTATGEVPERRLSAGAERENSQGPTALPTSSDLAHRGDVPSPTLKREARMTRERAGGHEHELMSN